MGPDLDVTSRQPVAAPDTTPSLLDAALRLATVFAHQGSSLTASADRIEGYDAQPYPVPAAPQSNLVAAFLRALDRARQAREDGRPDAWAEPAPPRPRYGPPLREVG